MEMELKFDLGLQYRKAITAGAIAYFDVNLTEDTLDSRIIMKIDGKEIDALKTIGIDLPYKFSEFTRVWHEQVFRDYDIKTSPKLDFTQFNKELINDLENGIYARSTEYWTKEIFGRPLFIRQGILLTRDVNGSVKGLVVLRDLTNPRSIEESRQKAELERYAYVDPITKGDNYIKFKENLRKHNKAGYLISMDLHSFKIINSICGIAKGDEVLRIIWGSLKTNLEAYDIAGHINADHFIFFLSRFDVQSPENEKGIEKILQNITLTLNFLSAELDVPQLSPYFGVTFWNPEDKIEMSYSRAVAAKHKIKDRKDQNIAFFSQADTDRLIFEKKMEDAFESALNENRFEVWYQPKYNPTTTTLVGAEALVRWRKLDGELIPPGLFIPLFERNGMIRILDEYVFKTVCKQQRKWLDEGIDIVPVSINLSRASLYFSNVANQYKWIAEKIGIDTNYVPIEITESATVNNIDIKALAESFYKAGFPLHMDDFGSGYSSLATLNTMHFDTLKLDKSLIDFIGNYGGDRLLEHTIALAKELGMYVTAEGVESGNQVEFLQNLRCDSIQGYYYSRPLPVQNFEKSLLVSSVIESFDKVQSLENYIRKIKLPAESNSLYEFVVNLTEDKILNIKGISQWREETNSEGLNDESKRSYTEETTRFADKMLLPEYRVAYKAFMNREYLIKSSFGRNEIRSLEYERMYKGKQTKMRMTIHLFKIQSNDDLWMYVCISDMTGLSGFNLSALNFEDKDSLTGLYNRIYVLNLIKEKVQEAKVKNEKRVLVLADIDKFKDINKTFGYKFGDEILAETAHRIRDFFPHCTVGRIGGDKFMILLGDFQKGNIEYKIDTREDIISLINRFKNQITRTYYKKGQPISVTLSVGYSIYPDDETDIDTLFSEADVLAFSKRWNIE